MQTGDRITVKIEKLLFGGCGLAHGQSGEGSLAVFVPGVVPGETVSVEIARVKKGYAEGKLLEIIHPSPHRRTPPESDFWECGGCDLQHIEEGMQLTYKVEAFREVLSRIARLRETPLAPAVSSPEPFGYRFRVELKVDAGRLGFYRRGSHEVVKIDHCPIAHPLINRILPRLSQTIEQGSSECASIKEVQLQVSEQPDQILITCRFERFEADRFAPLFESLRRDFPVVGLVLRAGRKRHLFGRDHVLFHLMEETLRASDGSFVQANWRLNERMAPWVVSALGIEKEDRVLELYSGIGNFTLPFARRAQSVVAVEGNRSAVKDAKWNVKNAGLDNVHLMEGPAEWAVQRLQGRFNRIFLDPPRSGANPAVIQFLPTARRLVYLSCHPATLARDLRILIDRGWRLATLQPFDMFPQTSHLEVAAVLENP
jgi:23S rRNA (uracil1939-C5)-methyltransferase